MAELSPNSSPEDEESLLSSLGEEMIRILTPVSICMLSVVILVTILSSSSSAPPIHSSIATMAYSEDDNDDSTTTWDRLYGALLNSLAFVATITLMTFLLLLLFYFRLTNFLRIYMAFSSFLVLSFLGGDVSVLLLDRFRLPVDAPTFLFLLFNLSALRVLATISSIFAAVKIPILVTQGYLVGIGVLVAYWFTMLPEWTTWTLLVAMSLYDLAAVLLPIGPLRLLVEMAISRDEEIPALVYEARPVETVGPTERRRLWRNAPPPPPAESTLEEALLQETEHHEMEDNVEGIGLGSSGAIKLGLGDFIFYSVLVGRAALYDFMAVYACYLAIIAGLGITLMLLAFYRRALPALPVSVMLGVVFYFLTRFLLEVFVVQCSTNFLMF